MVRAQASAIGLVVALAIAAPAVASAQDADGDGLSDVDEGIRGTDPLAPDSDADTLPDGAEALTLGTDPLVPDGATCQLGPAQVVGHTYADNPAETRAADLDGDGDLDLLVTSADFGATLVWQPNLGDGTFGAAVSIPI